MSNFLKILIGVAIFMALSSINLSIQALNLEQISCKLDVNPITAEMLK